MTKSLPERPNLTNLKKQAKSLLKAHKTGEPSACALLRNLHRFSGKSAAQILAAELTLADAQFAIAIEYGFKDWTALKAHVPDNKEIVRRATVEAMNRGDAALERALVSQDCVVHDPSGKTRLFKDILKERPEGSKGRLPKNAKWVADDMIAEGDKVAIRWSMIADANTPSCTNISICKLRDGKIIEAWHPTRMQQKA